MFFRKSLVCFCLWLAALLLLASCQTKREFEFNENRVIDRQINHGDSSRTESSHDNITLSGSMEYSDLIILGTITEKTDVSAEGRGGNYAVFEYEVTVDSIFYDRRGTAQVGQALAFRSGCGYMLCTEFHRLALYENDLPDHELAENEYYVFNQYNMLPFETGRQFVIFLDDEDMETSGVYQSGSRGQNWCYENGTLYHTAEAKIRDGDLNDLRDMIDLAVSERLGIRDT